MSDAAGMRRAAISHWFGHSAAGGMTMAATQMEVHQGQCARYAILPSSPKRRMIQRR